MTTKNELEHIANLALLESDEAKRHLRQLLYALDSMEGADLSYNVRQTMREARRYLQDPAGREES